MSGDTYTPPSYEHSTAFDDGNVLDFRKAGEHLISQSAVEAARAVDSAYQQRASEQEQVPSAVEIAGLQLAKLHEVRNDRLAA
jgi:hypothetical protein